jgi:LmbE family N-acetylglucosaminyl deacetylase
MIVKCLTLLWQRRTKVFSLPLAVLACTLLPASPHAQSNPPAGSRTLLAVFAHPDDETMAGPLLAHYAGQPGTRVYVAVVTNGEKGVTPFANIPAGEQLAAARAKEAACACDALGAEAPILMGLPDGGLNTSQILAEMATKLKAVIDKVRPDAIVTWGPDGGYGHPDHRLVSAVATQVVQSGGTTRLLYYVGLPKSRLESDAMKALRFPAPFTPVVDEVLTTRVPYTEADAQRARQSLKCHKSQFTPQAMETISSLTEKIHAGEMHLRLWSGGDPRTDLFDR